MVANLVRVRGNLGCWQASWSNFSLIVLCLVRESWWELGLLCESEDSIFVRERLPSLRVVMAAGSDWRTGGIARIVREPLGNVSTTEGSTHREIDRSLAVGLVDRSSSVSSVEENRAFSGWIVSISVGGDFGSAY